MTTRVAAAALLVTASVLGAGCAKDEGASVRNGSSGSSAASGSSSASGSSAAVGCKPIGEDLEAKAKTTVDVKLVDYAFELSRSSVPVGITTFRVTNGGKHDHELAFLPGGGKVPLTSDGDPDEAALEKAGAFELEAIAPGTDCSATWKLEPGTYTVFCVIKTDGMVHSSKGMTATFKVT